jgi:hypothetical protein
MFRFLDAYSIRTRLFPALLPAAPALAALALLISWERIAFSNVIATTELLVLVFALADLARKLGPRVESKIYAEMGGKPSVVMFRRSDTTIEGPTKDRYRTFIAGKIKQPAPTASKRRATKQRPTRSTRPAGPGGGRTLATPRNSPCCSVRMCYGFRRNLLGLKPPSPPRASAHLIDVIYGNDGSDRIRLSDLSERADDATFLANSAWPQRIMARPFAIDCAGVVTLRIPDYSERPFGARPHVNIDEDSGTGNAVGLCPSWAYAQQYDGGKCACCFNSRNRSFHASFTTRRDPPLS